MWCFMTLCDLMWLNKTLCDWTCLNVTRRDTVLLVLALCLFHFNDMEVVVTVHTELCICFRRLSKCPGVIELLRLCYKQIWHSLTAATFTWLIVKVKCGFTAASKATKCLKVWIRHKCVNRFILTCMKGQYMSPVWKDKTQWVSQRHKPSLSPVAGSLGNGS